MFWPFPTHAQACKQVADWSRGALEQLADLKAEQRADWDPVLAQWDQLVRSLWQEADGQSRSLIAGDYHPDACQSLLQRAWQSAAAFARFLDQINLPKEVRPMEAEEVVPIGKHVLPPLPYAYDALEPYIDAETMHLHHDKHHLSYVNGLNNAEIMMAQARTSGDFDLIKHWEREAAFNGAGHYLHTLFWQVMKPHGGGSPPNDLAEQIVRDFGTILAFQNHFSAAAEKVEGGGWAILVWSPRPRRLEILQAEKHQNLSQWDVVPLLPLDVWEHAYYLKYKNDRKAYINAWWNLVNWETVAERFRRARELKWEPA